MRADLHSHSVFSDGKETPADLVKLASERGVRTLALTDHDTLDGLPEALDAGRRFGVAIVPGVEFSCVHLKAEVHVLGLWVDFRSPSFAAFIADLGRAREERARRMVAKCRAMGAKIEFDKVRAIAGRGVMGRPHLAQALKDAGVVWSVKEAFYNYIGRTGPCYEPKRELSPAEAIRVTREAGGIAALAHPMIGGLNKDQVAELVAGAGFDAVEVVHPKLTAEQGKWLRALAAEKGLGVSGGSDWHGEEWSDGRIGDYTVTAAEVEDLFDRRKAERGGWSCLTCC